MSRLKNSFNKKLYKILKLLLELFDLKLNFANEITVLIQSVLKQSLRTGFAVFFYLHTVSLRKSLQG